MFLLILLVPLRAGAADCDSFPHADTLLRPGVIVLLGEIHGTDQCPAVVSTLVCRALQLGLRVNVGLEIPIEEQPRIDRYLSSAGTKRDRDSLLAGEFWQRSYQDGRSSQAMVRLIESLRQITSDTTSALRVLAIDGPDRPEGRDSFMANRLVTAHSEWQPAFTIALTGNIHNRLITGSHFDPDYQPMGYDVWLQSPEFEVFALDLAHSGGTAWICSAQTGCGVVPLSGHASDPGVELFPAKPSEPYSGRFHVGEITASLPAKDL